jgi:hypothetical protein
MCWHITTTWANRLFEVYKDVFGIRCKEAAIQGSCFLEDDAAVTDLAAFRDHVCRGAAAGLRFYSLYSSRADNVLLAGWERRRSTFAGRSCRLIDADMPQDVPLPPTTDTSHPAWWRVLRLRRSLTTLALAIMACRYRESRLPLVDKLGCVRLGQLAYISL